MQPNRLATAFAAIALAALGAAGAHAATLVDGSFENTTGFVPDANDTMTLSPGSTTITGWTVETNQIAWIGPTNTFGLTAANGNYFLDLTGYSDHAPYGAVTQSIATTPGSLYQLTFDLGSSARYGIPDSITATAGSASQTFTSTSNGLNQWKLETLDFVGSPGASTQITLAGSSGNYYIGLDSVSVAGVPEPATWAMLMLGVAGVGAGLRTRRKEATGALAA